MSSSPITNDSDASDHNAGYDPHERIHARLFDADRSDQRLTWDELLATEPTDRQLLWVDITGDVEPDDARRLAERFELGRRALRSLETEVREPMLRLQGPYLHARVAAEPDARDPSNAAWLDLIAAPNVTISQHRGKVDFMADVDDRIRGDTPLGILTSIEFFAAILDAAITSYHRVVDAIEEDVDRLDAWALRGDDRTELLEDLVQARRRIARLRRLLADHRSVFASLSSPEVVKFVDDSEAAGLLQSVSGRFDGALGAVEDGRDALLGSFDVFMSRTAQRTNDVMKVLTLATVLLLPGSMIAGLLGMNVVVPLGKDDPMSFWIVVIAIAVLAVAIVLAARSRRWL
jgi:Mg2+ and Co2+ transporter CorA